MSLRLRDTSAPLRAVHAPIALLETYALTKRRIVGNTLLSAIKKAVAKPFLPPTASKSMFECTLRKSRLNVMCRAVKRHSIHCTGRKSLPISLVDVAVAILQVARIFCLCLSTIVMLLLGTDMNINPPKCGNAVPRVG